MPYCRRKRDLKLTFIRTFFHNNSPPGSAMGLSFMKIMSFFIDKYFNKCKSYFFNYCTKTTLLRKDCYHTSDVHQEEGGDKIQLITYNFEWVCVLFNGLFYSIIKLSDLHRPYKINI